MATSVGVEIALVVLGAGLGSVGALGTQRALELRREHAQKRAALRDLDRVLASVQHAVAHGHDFRNKRDWHRVLDRLANEDRGRLDELYVPAKRIAWRIRDQSFDHREPDAAEYCCDELKMEGLHGRRRPDAGAARPDPV